MAPADPRSQSCSLRLLHSCGVYQSSNERLTPERCSSDSPKLETPSQSPFPVTAMTFPLPSIAGARPDCQIADCRPLGALLKTAVAWSVAGSYSSIQP